MHGFGTPFDLLEPGEQDIIAIVINRSDHISALISTGIRIAIDSDAHLIVYALPELDLSKLSASLARIEQDRITIERLDSKRPAAHILRSLKPYHPIFIGLALEIEKHDPRYPAGKELDQIVQQARCPVYLVKSEREWSLPDSPRTFIPFWDDDNSRFAIDTAFAVNPQLHITCAIVVPEEADAADLAMQEEAFCQQTQKWSDSPCFHRKILRGTNVRATLLGEARTYDFFLVGASKGNWLTRTLFGDTRVELINEYDGPGIIVREYQGRAGASFSASWRFLDNLLPNLSKADRIEAYRTIRRGGRPSRDFFTMIALSAAIASLGLVLDSGAVIIGAMLVAPLMSAIVGMGMAIIQGDVRFLEQTLRTTLKGTLIAIVTGFLLGLINFHGEATAQMLQRTAPSILDLAIALVSGVAAAYAICNKNVSNSFPGLPLPWRLCHRWQRLGSAYPLAIS